MIILLPKLILLFLTDNCETLFELTFEVRNINKVHCVLEYKHKRDPCILLDSGAVSLFPIEVSILRALTLRSFTKESFWNSIQPL